MSYIANVYADLIRKHEVTGKTIDDVPKNIRAEVEELLGIGEDNETDNQ